MSVYGARLSAEIPEALAGERLDKALSALTPDLTRTRIQGLIAEGRVLKGADPVLDASYRVKSGDSFDLLPLPPAPLAAEPQAIALDIVYEDDDLIVLNKPADMVVHPAVGNPDNTLVNALLHHCGGGLPSIGGEERPGIVHRLDKDTTGLMVVAKSEHAHQGLQAQFEARAIERRYRAVVWGRPPAQGSIDAAIGRDPRNRKRMAVVAALKGKAAVTHFSLIRPLGGAAGLIECRLETGRTHQIRVHMTHRGHPLIGDPLYGRASRARLAALAPAARAAAQAFHRQALHAMTLGFRHPRDNRFLRFEAPVPQDMLHLIKNLESL